MSGHRSFFAELRRRNVHRAAVFYAGTAWLVVQVATQVFPFFHIAEWVVRWIVIAAAVGFPFAMVFSWFYEWTPQGIRRESEIVHEELTARGVGRRLDKAIIAVLTLAVLVLLLNQLVLRRVAPAAATGEKSVAVLPFVNTSGDAGNEYFSDGLSEELINTLGRLQNLKVIGRTSSFQFKGKSDDAKTIGEKLGVTALLEGSVRKQGDRVRILAELVNVADGRQLWAETYDRELKDIFTTQSEIAGAVATQLKVALLGGDVPGDATTPNVEAYNALLQGRFYSRRGTIVDIRKGAGYFDEAIRLDPAYALAYTAAAGAALTRVDYSDLGDAYSLSDVAKKDLLDKARSGAETALRLAPGLGAAHALHGKILRDLDWDIVSAEREFRRAVELSPQDVGTVRAQAGMVAMFGHFEEALVLAQRASALDPLDNAARFTIASCLLQLGRYDEAEAILQKAIDQQPQAEGIRAYLAMIQVAAGKPAAALDSANKEPIPFWRLAALTIALFANGQQAESDATLKSLIDGYGERNAVIVASAYAARKEPEQMFAWLERGWAARDLGVRGVLVDPFLVTYKNDPRFIAFVQKVGLTPPVDSSQ